MSSSIGTTNSRRDASTGCAVGCECRKSASNNRGTVLVCWCAWNCRCRQSLRFHSSSSIARTRARSERVSALPRYRKSPLKFMVLVLASKSRTGDDRRCDGRVHRVRRSKDTAPVEGRCPGVFSPNRTMQPARAYASFEHSAGFVYWFDNAAQNGKNATSRSEERRVGKECRS